MIARRAHMVLLVGTMTLSACATARLHDQAELNLVGQRCGLALGELFQDESEKRLLFLINPETTAGQRLCVTQWARKNRLKPVFIDNIVFQDN